MRGKALRARLRFSFSLLASEHARWTFSFPFQSFELTPDYLSQAAANGEGDLITVPPGAPLPRLSQQQQHLCPITRCPMEDPTVAADGFTYER